MGDDTGKLGSPSVAGLHVDQHICQSFHREGREGEREGEGEGGERGRGRRGERERFSATKGHYLKSEEIA